ncbi:sigma-54-dependent transcriptional regulator [Luteimonas deserti]|uniref:Sigma-54-dependent Fis family transcriptional regulator n=1 Tax=Luteimonas deserti TaxID=2752306 RepID=A0A7Z0U157_9GAMM|nr:sigma 54-interacting transcriptional regulator [Luteimonas deserti]NYZ63998.1 sigma-54-dependent Fis family transcriptional regulator [Luteimonas deserti]
MPQPTALILDDDGTFARAAAQLAFSAGFRVQLAETLAEARQFLGRSRADLMLLDLQLPDGSGMDLLDDVDLSQHGQIVIVTGRPSLETATRAVSRPILDYLLKPLDPARLRALLDRVAARYRPPARASAEPSPVAGVIGNSPRLRSVVDTVLRAGPTDASVLMWGEVGTGKRLFARALHMASGRPGECVAVDCAALGDAAAAALFGEDALADGAMPGAVQRARGGTLFLDAVDALPQAVQLRLAQDFGAMAVTPGDDAATARSEVRVIAATVREPGEAVREHVLREDLYYALAHVTLAVPPLRDRGEDVVVLASHFIDRLNSAYGRGKRLAPGSEAVLLRHSWPGNVHELRSAVQRAYLLQDEDLLHVKPDLPSAPVWQESDTSILFSVGTTLAEIERRALLKTLAHFNNDKTATARALGVSVRTIHNQLARLGARGDGSPRVDE